MKLPKVDEVRKKARAIEGAKNFTLKEEDIEQVINESVISLDIICTVSIINAL